MDIIDHKLSFLANRKWRTCLCRVNTTPFCPEISPVKLPCAVKGHFMVKTWLESAPALFDKIPWSARGHLLVTSLQRCTSSRSRLDNWHIAGFNNRSNKWLICCKLKITAWDSAPWAPKQSAGRTHEPPARCKVVQRRGHRVSSKRQRRQVAWAEHVMDSETIGGHVRAVILPLLCLLHIKISVWVRWVRCTVSAHVQSSRVCRMRFSIAFCVTVLLLLFFRATPKGDTPVWQ